MANQNNFKTIMVILFIFILSISSVLGDVDGLYSTEDDVLSLSNETFNRVMESKQQGIVWVVEFYNSWCGHCIHFAPTWKKLATEMKDWGDMIVIAAIDCSQQKNLGTCRSFGIDGYPTILIFPPVFNSSRKSLAYEIKSTNLPPIKEEILKVLTQYPTDAWPHLEPLMKIEDIWQHKKSHHKHILLIFEEKGSHVGKQVMLDVRKMTSVLVQSMVKDSVEKFGIKKFPSLYKVNNDSTYKVMAVGSHNNEEDRYLFVKVIRSLAVGDEGVGSIGSRGQMSEVSNHGSMLGKNDKQDQPSKVKANSSVVSMQDLESAIHYSFRQEVAIMKVIDSEKLAALKDFVSVLAKYFPGRKPVLGFLGQVVLMLGKLDRQNLTGEEWMGKIDGIQDQDNFLPDVIKWQSCQGSSAQYRGFPCSMWTLFHTLTVAAYFQNQAARQSNPQEVLLAVRGYMKHFFGCKECSINFLQMAQSVPEEVRDHKGAVLWLWTAHNKANKRLHGDASEDPKHPKVQFPPESLCPKCQTMTQSPNEGMKLSWDQEQVLTFLTSFYSPKSIVFPLTLQSSAEALEVEEGDDDNSEPSERAIKELDWWEKMQKQDDLKNVWRLKEKLERRRGSLGRLGEEREISYALRSERNFLSTWGLTQTDLSMCVVFYVLSTVLIILLYHHFIVRRRMISCKNSKSFI